jgi:hypothetical protein
MIFCTLCKKYIYKILHYEFVAEIIFINFIEQIKCSFGVDESELIVFKVALYGGEYPHNKFI